MALSDYLTGIYGIGQHSYYLFMWVFTWNPALFKVFKWYHYPILAVGTLFSYFDHRAIIPFMLLTFLDLDYEKMDINFFKTLAFFFLVEIIIYGVFSGTGL